MGVHAVIGGKRPNTNISIVGVNGPLVHTANPIIFDHYDGVAVAELSKIDGGDPLLATE